LGCNAVLLFKEMTNNSIIMKRQILLLLFLGTSLTIWTQNNSSLSDFESIFVDVADDANNDDTLFVPESWDVNLDSLMNSWHVQHYVTKNEHSGYREPVIASDSVYVDRLSRLNNIMELPYNEIVRNCIDMYVDRRRKTMEYMLGLERFYFPMIEQALDQNDLPHELKYLAIVESALNPVAVSRAGATGLWQFMLGTGKQYGLEINSLVDERRDPLKATYAACEYFKDMYRIYGDWTLVIAAYNCGPGNVNKAIRRANGSTDYWKIYPYLPRETRSYVPLFIAATYAMNYYAHHQLYPVQTSLPLATDTIMVEQAIHFDQIAAILDIDKETLRALNPQYKKDIVPGNTKPRAIKLPALQAYAFAELEDSIANHRRGDYFTNRTYVGDATGNNNEKITHRVVKGETLASIGSKYGVTAANIRRWNGLKSNSVAAGRRLTIYADNGGIVSTNSSSSSNSTTKPKTTTSTKASTTGQYANYKVRSGDSFYSIAKRYPGVSHNDLMRINNMKSPQLKVGQIIKVPKV